jgi:hypothetical protein
MLIHGAVDNDIYPPRFGGPQRSFGLFRGLATRNEVRVLCLVPNRADGKREETVSGVTLLRRKAWYTSLAWRLERAGLAPLQSAAELHGARARTLRAALPGSPDVLAAEFSMCGLLDPPGAALGIYLSQNVEADFFAATAPNMAMRSRWCARVRTRERRAVERAGLTVVVSDEDAARMVELHGAEPKRLAVIPNGWDETVIRPGAPAERAAARDALGIGSGDWAALFVGSDVPHNRDAARLLVEEVFPPVARRGGVLLLAGAVSRSLGTRREPWLRVLGELDDLAPALHAADAGLNPVTRGGGSNVKVPTYLGAGLAVVTTRFGLRGYAALEPWVTLAEPEHFADVCGTRPSGWRARGEAMPAAVAELTWGRLGERLGELCEARLGSAVAPARRESVADVPPPARRAIG